MQFAILGPLAVVRDGTAIDLGAPKQRAVLAFLAAHAGEPVSLDRLIDELWGDEAPPRATASLQAYVSNLRRVLEPDRPPRTPATVLVSRAPGYALDLPPGALDADRFADHAARAVAAHAAGDHVGAVAASDEALALWRGEVLADFPYDPFAAEVRIRLDQHRLHVRELRAEGLLALDRPADAALELEELTRRHPLRERLWELLMLARYRSGRQADALRAFADARAVLIEELGLEPGPALRDLERRILDHDPGLAVEVGRTTGGEPASPPPAPPGTATDGPDTGSTTPHGRGEEGIVGRRRELEALEQAWRDARDGRSRVAAIGGEPGIGKTSLAQALEAEALRGGAWTAWGRSHEQAGSAPLWPWTQVARTLVGALDDAGATLDPELSSVLAPVLGGVGPGARGEDVDAARLRLFDAVSRLLTAAAAERPVLVVLDDLQWADVDSLRLLDYLSAELVHGRVLVLLTYREEEARPGTPLADALATVARRPGTARLVLGGLPGDAVGRYAERLCGTALAPATVSVLLDRTSGNPFFVGEMVRLLASEHRLGADDAAASEVPSGVRDVVRRRVDRLPEDSQAVLRVAAVTGREFTVDELAAACALEVDEVLDALEPPLVTALVEEQEGPGERFRFAHAIVGETLAGDLSSTRRRRLHLRIAQALETVHARDLEAQSPRLAHHYAEAAALGHAGTASRYAALAARRARAGSALDESARLWRLAHAMAVADDEADPRTVMEITVELASALAGVGDNDGRPTSVEAMDRALALDDLDAAVRAAESLTSHNATWVTAGYRDPEDAAVARLERLLEVLGDGDSPARARTLGVYASMAYYRDTEAAGEAAEAGVEIARRLGDDELLAACLVRRLSVHYQNDVTATAAADELLEVARRMGAPRYEAIALVSRTRTRFALADVEGADADAAAAAALEAEHPSPLLALQAAYYPVLRAVLDGDLEEAERRADATERQGQRVSMWGAERWIAQMSDIRTFQGRLEELEPFVDLLRVERPDYGLGNLAALVRFETDRPEEGLALLREQGGIEPPAHDWRRRFEQAVAARCAHHAGDVEAARALYADLVDAAGRLANSGDLNGAGPVDTYLGLLALTMGEAERARRHLVDAVELAERLGSPTFEAQARLHLAATVDDATEAAHHLELALARAEATGMARVAELARRALGSRRVAS